MIEVFGNVKYLAFSFLLVVAFQKKVSPKKKKIGGLDSHSTLKKKFAPDFKQGTGRGGFCFLSITPSHVLSPLFLLPINHLPIKLLPQALQAQYFPLTLNPSKARVVPILNYSFLTGSFQFLTT
jgi:hypothetical protein